MSYGEGKYTFDLVDGWGKLPEGWSFKDVVSLFVDSHDRVFVFSRSEHPVVIFDRDGNMMTSWGTGLFNRCHGISAGPDGSVYCTDDATHTVYKFTFDGKLLMTLGTKDQPSDTGYTRHSPYLDSMSDVLVGNLKWNAWADTIERAGGPFNRPTGVALSATGEIYVSDGEGNARVHKFTPDGRLLFSWGEPGRAPGQFRIPHSVRVDKDERVWVVDRQNYRIQIFNDQGAWIGLLSDFKKRPMDIAFGDDGEVYTAEQNRRISVFSREGKVLARWGCEGERKATDLFLNPATLAVDSHGDLYVGETAVSRLGVDRGPRVLQKFSRKV